MGARNDEKRKLIENQLSMMAKMKEEQ